MSAIIRREVFAGALEGYCLPGGEFVVALTESAVLTGKANLADPADPLIRRRVESPEPLRYPVLAPAGARIAAQAQPEHSRATWEYVEADGRWYDRGGNSGVRPCVYLPDGTLVIERGGAGHPVDGWAGTGLDGNPVRIVPFDPVRNIHEYTELGPFLIGQSSIDGIELQLDGQRYQVEPGDVHTIWAVLGPEGVLAVATRKLAQNETVLLWLDVNAITELPPAPTKPPIVVPPVIVPPVIVPPKEPPVTDQQNPLPTFIASLLPVWLAKYPVPQIGQDEGDDSFTERMRNWMLPLQEQIEYLAPGQGYGRKRGDPGRPWGKDTIPRVTKLDGHTIVEGEGWDIFIGTSAGHPSFNPNVRSVNLAGQYFETVAPVNHLGAKPVDPPIEPKPDGLEARLKAVEARIAGIESELAGAAQLNEEQWSVIRELQATLPITVDLSQFAKKGDAVTVRGKIDLGFISREVVGHGTIDK